MKKPKHPKLANEKRTTLSDLKLHPWTPERIIRAQEIGQLHPNLGKQEWEQYRRTQVYPGAIKDVMIFLYLSTLPGGEVESATYEDAKKFGIKRGLHFADSPAFWDGYSKFIETTNEVYNAATKPKSEENSGNEEEEFPK